MIYLIQTTSYTLLMYLVYVAALRNRTSHGWNRWYLLACALVPPVLPLVSVPGIADQLPTVTYTLPEAYAFQPGGGTETPARSTILVMIYAAISLLLLGRHAYSHLRIAKVLQTKRATRHEGANVHLQTGFGPGSVGTHIFFPGSETNPTILAHELAHVHLKHTTDMVVLRVLQCAFWPNVALHMVAKELQMVHEFQADERSTKDLSSFSDLLLAHIFNVTPGAIVHTFFHHPIKRRIAMLQKNRSNRGRNIAAMLRSGAATLILATGIIYLQSCSRKAMPEPIVYTKADEMPHTDYDLATYLGNNIKYPEDAKKKKLEGRVIVKFIVDKNGEIKKPEAVRSPDAILSDEAIRVVSAMPRWTPGKNGTENVPVYFYLPISFRLDDPKPGETQP